MFCRFCGARVPDNGKFCPTCGAELTAAPTEPPAPDSLTCSPAPTAPEYLVPNGSPVAVPERGMKWFKFIIYFQLWLSMLLNLSEAGRLFTGDFYEGAADLVYALYPGLKPLDMLVGIGGVGLAVYAVLVQRALAKFRAKGPKMYCMLYGASIVLGLLYGIGASLVLGASAFDASSFGTISGSVAMILINRAYFNNRKHLFVNP